MSYWTERGKTYEAEYAGEVGPADDALRALLTTAKYDSVLDVGCGFGRIGKWLQTIRPGAAYVGVDISPDLVKSAHRRCLSARVLDVTNTRMRGQWDLVLAVSVLSHIPPDQVAGVAAKLREWTRHDLVIVDWTGPRIDPEADTPYQWLHDYGVLFPDATTTPCGIVTLFHCHA